MPEEQQPNQHRRPKAEPDSLDNVEAGDTVHHQTAASKKRKEPAKAGELNLTSMLDVTFQLLIFFVLTASFAVGEGVLPADLPKGGPQSGEEPPDQPIRIMLLSRGGDDVSIQVEQLPSAQASFRELYQVLKSQNNKFNSAGAFNADDPVIIKPDATVNWEHVVGAFNAAIHAEYSNISFARAGK